MSGYQLTSDFYAWCFENPEKVKPIHSAIYFFIVDRCNKMGWKKKFGLPTDMTMEAIGVKNYKTYINGLNDLIDFGFIFMVEKSRNQHTANIIELVNFTKADGKADTKAIDKALPKQMEKQDQSTVSINKLVNNKTIKLINDNPELVNLKLSDWIKNYNSDKKELPFSLESFIDFFNKETGKKMRRSNALEKKLLDLVDKGYTEEDFKAVVISKTQDFTGRFDKQTGKPMTDYLRPSTLFGANNFERYIADAETEIKPTTKSKSFQEYMENNQRINTQACQD